MSATECVGSRSNVDGNIHLENFACTSGVKERTVRLIQTSPGMYTWSQL